MAEIDVSHYQNVRDPRHLYSLTQLPLSPSYLRKYPSLKDDDFMMKGASTYGYVDFYRDSELLTGRDMSPRLKKMAREDYLNSLNEIEIRVEFLEV